MNSGNNIGYKSAVLSITKFERTYENLPGPFKGSILDPVHTKGTLFLNNYRLYGVNQ